MPRLFKKQTLCTLASTILLFASSPATWSASNAGLDLQTLQAGQIIEGFKTEALYLNDSDRAFGARFKHEKTGFTLDLMQIQSVPQAFIWANTLINSDSGVAHTQEHLLLGKGNKGRNLGTQSQMALVRESAGTAQWRTFYHFNTSAGPDVFYHQLDQYLDALLNPDYTDEEIRREVRNFAVKEDSKTKKLMLEEKGTVYNEMVSNLRSPSRIGWTHAMQMIYGKEHPLSYVSGGTPEGIRALKPEEIRRFHAEKYVLSNMGMIGSFARSMDVRDILNHLDKTLNNLQPAPSNSIALEDADQPKFPTPNPMRSGTIDIVSFPEKNLQKPGSVGIIWPPRADISIRERLFLSFFFDSLADDADTPLYKLFVDSKTLKIETGATGISSFVSTSQGFPSIISLEDVAQAHINPTDIAEYRSLITHEIAKIAKWPDDSKELAEFNAKMLSRLSETRRASAEYINNPPGFGTRGNNGGFMNQFIMLDMRGGFQRYITLKPDYEQLDKLLKSKTNVWRDLIAKWHLLDSEPMALGMRPDPEIISKEENDTKERIAIETKRLMTLYAVSDPDEALRRYKEDYDKNTVKLEELASASAVSSKLVDSPPMTFDDQLEYKVSTLAGKIPLVTSTFDSMTKSTAILALRLDSVPQQDLIYLSALPDLMSSVGVIDNGVALSYEETLKRKREQILHASVDTSTNPRTKRFELLVEASGTNPDETNRSVYWMKLLLLHPNWRPENLHRIRDVIEQMLSAERRVMDDSYEEHWDAGLQLAFRRQTSLIHLNLSSFLTKSHNLQRMRWLLKGDADADSIKTFVEFTEAMRIAGADANREVLKEFLLKLSKQSPPVISSSTELSNLSERYSELTATAKALLADAAEDLTVNLTDIPDGSLSMDWKTLCGEIASDIQVKPAKTLEKLDQIRRSLLLKDAARVAVIGSTDSQKVLQGPLEQLVGELGDKQFEAAKYSEIPAIVARMRERSANIPVKRNGQPLFSGFVNSRTHQGIIMNTSPAIKYSDTDDESLESALALNLYAGSGAQGMFMKTWGAGLAYGNGCSWACLAQITYYADKMPSIPDTMRFVADVLKKARAKPDTSLLNYVIAQCFYTRAASNFDSRGEALAEDLADGVTPDTVRHFRQAVLDISKKPGLIDALYARLLPAYGKVIPGLGVKAVDVEESCYMTVGDEAQLTNFEDYLKSVEGPDARIYRVWPRDYWINSGSSIFAKEPEQK